MENTSKRQFFRKSDWKIIFTLVSSTLLIVLDHYHAFFPTKWMDHFFLYLVTPLFFIVFVYRQSPNMYGFRLGNWKAGLLLTLVACILLTLTMAFVARTTDFRAYYGLNQQALLNLLLTNASDLIGWEFIFRGWLLFTLLPICGPYAILLQAVPFTIAHFGKPELETISCIFGGPLLGLIAWRTRSFLYPFLIHWYLTTITILLSRAF